MEGERKVTKKKMRFLATTTNKQKDGEDRISSLPDELIHHIFWFSDVQTAVQTSVLSKRWKLVWTTLPFLNFSRYNQRLDQYIGGSTFDYFQRNFANLSATEIKLYDKFFSHRNHVSDILKMSLSFLFGPPPIMVRRFVVYAISHRVQELNVHIPDLAIQLSTFSSTSIKKLTLEIDLRKLSNSFLDCWDLPALTTLHLIRPSFLHKIITIAELYLICLPCLQTLFLDGVQLPDFLSLPDLRTLYLAKCKLPYDVLDFSALSTLTLDDVEFPEIMTDFFSSVANLRNLTWIFPKGMITTDCVINCPQLVNLHIYACMSTFSNHSGKFIVLAPKIRNFSSVGAFPITFGRSQLEYVNIKLRNSSDEMNSLLTSKLRNKYYRRLVQMFQGLGSAKILTLDLDVIEALYVVSDFLGNSPPPFYNLKYLKVPQGYAESRMSRDLKCYLLGRSPTATIVTTLPQKYIFPHTEAPSMTARNVVPQESLTSPINMLVGSENLHKTVSDNSLNEGVEENVVPNPIVSADRVSADRVTQIGVQVERIGSDTVSSSRGNSDFVVWHGHEVKSKFVCLLDLIMIKYLETFENFTAENKEACTTKLNMLCTTVNDFTKLSLTDVDAEMIALYRDIFSCLEKFGFRVSWLVNRLKYIEKLHFSHPLLSELHAIDCHIADAKSKLDLQVHHRGTVETKLQDLQTLRAEKVRKIQNAFGTTGRNVVIGYVGDDLFCNP